MIILSLFVIREAIPAHWNVHITSAVLSRQFRARSTHCLAVLSLNLSEVFGCWVPRSVKFGLISNTCSSIRTSLTHFVRLIGDCTCTSSSDRLLLIIGPLLPRAYELIASTSAMDKKNVNCRCSQLFVAHALSKPIGSCGRLLTSSTKFLATLCLESGST